MAVTSKTKHADKEAATSTRAMDFRSTSSNWLVGIGAGGALNVPGWRFVSADRPVVVATDCWPVSTPVAWQQAWESILKSPCQRSASIVNASSDFGALLPHIGSSSLIVDLRSMKRTPRMTIARLSNDEFDALSVADQLKELRAALSLNKSQLALVLQVTRPTIYEWYEGKDPNPTNGERIRTLLRVLARSAVSGARPLNARFVRQPMGLTEPSLLDLLCQDRLDQERLAREIERARDLDAAASRKRKNREDRLQALGFEDLSRDQRKALLARNVALQDWPRR